MAGPNRPLWQWSACELAEAIAARKVTAAEAVGGAVARMRATNGKINAVVNDLGEAALREAEAHDQAMSAGGPIGPLHGVPITIKENVDQTGCATPNGVVAFKDVMAPDDAPVVRNLRPGWGHYHRAHQHAGVLLPRDHGERAARPHLESLER
jgi:amidase